MSLISLKSNDGESDMTGFPDKALAFSVRANSSIVISAVQKWRRVLVTHRNASLFAVQYYCFKKFLQWRIALRKRLKMVRKAREADKYLHIRRAWKLWADKLADARGRKALQVWERRKVKVVFNGWHLVYPRRPRADLRSAQNGTVSSNDKGNTGKSRM